MSKSLPLDHNRGRPTADTTVMNGCDPIIGRPKKYRMIRMRDSRIRIVEGGDDKDDKADA
ncbi:unnamed protein product [Dovyalis caffra]|uniref:Uncharacterized protein n=1 Tax=Dovyalis caffra TaxID=77055 RepID=A0AAV1QQU2_9ROSI|nr:unnamed protein product [Dovyalis caffra]